MQSGVDNLEGVLSVASDHPLVFRAGNGAGSGNHEYMRLHTNGFVGIGTISPGARLHVDGGTDVSTNSGGYIVIGPTNGLNIGIDNNEIIPRNNGQKSEIFLNNNGGDVSIGGILDGASSSILSITLSSPANQSSHSMTAYSIAASPATGGFRSGLSMVSFKLRMREPRPTSSRSPTASKQFWRSDRFLSNGSNRRIGRKISV
jgi:hypothetical protein